MKSLRNLLLASASSVVFVGSAAAADMPLKAPPAPVVWNWAGPYAGLNLGAVWNNAKFSDLGGPAGFFGFPPGSADPFWSPSKAGITIGGQAGYNWQTNNFVYGIEGDLNWVDSKVSATFSPFGPTTIGASSNLDWMGSVRGRVGVAFSQWLVYGTGGVAFAHFSDAWGLIGTGSQNFTNNSTRVGWTAGGGVEYMLTRNWTVRVEGLYSDFGSHTQSIMFGGLGPYSSSFRHTVSTARAALNWKW